jgi:hypothetical protein
MMKEKGRDVKEEREEEKGVRMAAAGPSLIDLAA